eukprot:gnl/MRDRNA2_/MRDRNA2_102903_c0_seq1.p1 gnl/MRDRNA2_/MRDRNA2_102903_c0~~gnl/MRDRNA2_/MRDRNA2_102903_c0_seq1.p1  ORF type:complete len:225 (+),score=43.53 gnl/MRDRNA2_/MRDRNA2_102903_c0_seq1:96-770(+)
MHSIGVKLVFGTVAWFNVQQLVAAHASDNQNSMDKLVDKLADKLAGRVQGTLDAMRTDARTHAQIAGQAMYLIDKVVSKLGNSFLDQIIKTIPLMIPDLQNATLGQLLVHSSKGMAPLLSHQRPDRGVQVQAKQKQDVEYGQDWYSQTRNAIKKQNTRSGQQAYLDAWREANKNDRRDLYTEKWDGDEYKGSPFNILNVLIFLFIATPVFGLIFAQATYGKLWG